MRFLNLTHLTHHLPTVTMCHLNILYKALPLALQVPFRPSLHYPLIFNLPSHDHTHFTVVTILGPF